jgi:hypothetical protein
MKGTSVIKRDSCNGMIISALVDTLLDWK